MHEKAHLDATAKQANALVQHLHVHANSRRALEVSLFFCVDNGMTLGTWL